MLNFNMRLTMKQITKIAFASIISIAAFTTACKKPLYETEPIGRDLDYTFNVKDSVGTQAEGFLTDIYTNLPFGYNRIGGDVLDAATDDAVSSSPTSVIEVFTNGRLSPRNVVDDAWGKNYETIRKVNIFLANVDRVPHKYPKILAHWKTEARILRAIAYFELVKRYGGVPMIGDKVLTIEDDLEIAASPYQDCINYIVSECDAVKSTARPTEVSLPDDPNFGRMTVGVAYALKSRALLYAASPLNNPNGDVAKWAAAAQAAKDLMDLNEYQLEPKFLDVFITRKNSEIILSRQATDNTGLEFTNSPIGYVIGNNASGGRTSPTQNLVDAFEMANGKAITANGSGYNASNPYLGRDPRFYHTIFHNDMWWLNRKVETFTEGKDRPGSSVVVQTRTGYYMRKFLDDGYRGTGNRPTNYISRTHNFPIFRYAEILLNYAEAKNEAITSPDASVYKAIEDIRQRAGLAPYALPSGLNQAQMREVIRHERRIEMAFEEQRFWDIRRWKIAENVMNGFLGQMVITKTGTALSYNIVEDLKVEFDKSKMYHFPIPLSEINKNRNLKQPQGW